MPVFKYSLISFLFTFFSSYDLFAQQELYTHDLKDIYVRDPYILTDSIRKCYYLYRSKDVNLGEGRIVGGVEVLESKDLKKWSEPKSVFQAPADYWINGSVWAPEVHKYKGHYYLFLTLNSDQEWRTRVPDWPAYTYRSTQIFKATSPYGSFEAITPNSLLPKEWMTLDGTLWVEDGVPYMVYCHEWVQLIDGQMELVQLSEDLSHTIGQPQTLFKASDAIWSTGNSHRNGQRSYVTDGCFLYRTLLGKLVMIWSSFKNSSYAIGIAQSRSGSIKGPWIQQQDPLFESNAGHGMIFKDLNGQPRIVFHGPNSPAGSERAMLFTLIDSGDHIHIANYMNNYHSTLRKNLLKESKWIKVHTAEFLLWEGKDTTLVYDTFLQEELLYDSTLAYRIGIWRVLYQAARDPKIKHSYLQKIIRAYKTGEDKLHALETLAKLQIPLSSIDPLFTKELLKKEHTITSMYLYSLWNYYHDPAADKTAIVHKLLQVLSEESLADPLKVVTCYILRYVKMDETQRASFAAKSTRNWSADLQLAYWVSISLTSKDESLVRDDALSALRTMEHEERYLPNILLAMSVSDQPQVREHMADLYRIVADTSKVTFDADGLATAAYAMLRQKK